MAKLIEMAIDGCDECLWRDPEMGECYYGGEPHGEYTYGSIPSWCPLPDATEPTDE